jgi:metallo-beta-lactamase family protein
LETFWNQEAKDIKAAGGHPFDSKGLYAFNSSRDHQTLLTIPGPAIIISGSSMCSGERIIDHLQQGLDEPNIAVLSVG